MVICQEGEQRNAPKTCSNTLEIDAQTFDLAYPVGPARLRSIKDSRMRLAGLSTVGSRFYVLLVGKGEINHGFLLL